MTVEKVEIQHVKSRSNLYNVPLKAWRKWSPIGRQVFNELYSSMARNQTLFLHPHAEKISRQMWRTTAWNAAWIAASAASE